MSEEGLKERVKVCTECHEEKAVTAFYKNTQIKDGYYGQCKACLLKRKRQSRHEAQRRDANKLFASEADRDAYYAEMRAKYGVPGLDDELSTTRMEGVKVQKICGKCKQAKELGEFGSNKGTPDGLNYECRGCVALRSRERYAAKKAAQGEPAKSNGAVVVAEPVAVKVSEFSEPILGETDLLLRVADALADATAESEGAKRTNRLGLLIEFAGYLALRRRR